MCSESLGIIEDGTVNIFRIRSLQAKNMQNIYIHLFDSESDTSDPKWPMTNFPRRSPFFI